MHGDTGALVLNHCAWELGGDPTQALPESFKSMGGGVQVGVINATALCRDLESMQAGMIDAVGEPRSTKQIVETPSADDADRDTRLLRDALDQVPPFGCQLRRGRIGVELGERAIKIEQENEGAIGRPGCHRSQHFI